MATKICTKCGNEKDIELFVTKKKSPDGHASECKECHNNWNKKKYYEDIELSRKKNRESSKKHIKEHPEKKAAAAKRYREKYPDRVAQRFKDYYDANKEKEISRTKEYLKNNPEKKKQWAKNSYQKRKDKVKSYQKEYAKANKEKRNKRDVANRKNNLHVRIAHNLRTRLNIELKKKSGGGRFLMLLGCSMDYFIRHIESQFTDGMSWDNYGNGANDWSIDHFIPVALFNLEDEEQQKCAFSWCNMRPLWHPANVLKGSEYEGVRYNKSRIK